MNRVFLTLLIGLVSFATMADDPPPEPATEAVATAAATASAPPASPDTRTMDRLDLDSTAITGNRELPRVMSIVPWKRADIGDLAGKPANSLLDEALAPVDRDVFRREIDYFDALEASRPQAETPVTATGSRP